VRAAVDYRPFLGPDWEPEYTGASTIVANHSGYLDIVIITILKFPSFTPKTGIKSWPFIGQVCDLVFNSLFINRAGTPEEREKVTKDIADRQKLAEEGKAAPLLMYPEGCTTNNTQLITFRRGAFASLASIQPITMRYKSPFFNPAHDILDVISHMILVCAQPYSTCTVRELPVFRPNKYFFEHHQREGEEKWQTYMRVVRQLMGDSLKFVLSDARLEDKFAYKELLYPNKGAKNKFE
jgi:1-acyl-sn-glycerol-3-phosphate acyltransferase